MSVAYKDWCNENEERQYPLEESATGLDNRAINLPADILADLHIMVPYIYRNAYLSSAWVTDSLIGVSVAHASAPLSSAVVGRAAYTPGTAVPLVPAVVDAGVAGWVVFGHYRGAPGRWLFNTSAQSGLALRTVKPMTAPPITAFRKYGGNETRFASGIVRLSAAGYLSVYPHETLSNTIVFDLISADAAALFAGPCAETAGLDKCQVPPLRNINGVGPDDTGKITIRFE